MYLLGYDVGSSSVKASLLDASTGKNVASAFYPRQEMEITAEKPGWAEQPPSLWWKNLISATREVLKTPGLDTTAIKGIGISYQMHGLVLIDKNKEILRPSIIWCDSRAVEIGNRAFSEIGGERCLSSLLNSPGNFTASKLKWVKENEPQIFEKIYKILLPGDYIAMQLTGEVNTTISGLSEGILWDFKENSLAKFVMEHYGFDSSLIPEIVPTFSEQGRLSRAAAEELGLPVNIPVGYRAGDQPNNAFSLNVLNPGEIAATAGTSGVVYGISEKVTYDPESRVNTFAHVNHTTATNRLGVLLCINGTGILNSWIKHNFASEGIDYEQMNDLAASSPIGSKGLAVLPFGNGAERVLLNREPGCQLSNLNFNIHKINDIYRASQEGIVFSFRYGMDIMKQTGIVPKVIRAGKANMFLSPVFRNTLAGVTGATIQLYDTDGAQGAARGAGVGIGHFKAPSEAFDNLSKVDEIYPDKQNIQAYEEAYQHWNKELTHQLAKK
jgi:xylulokinase